MNFNLKKQLRILYGYSFASCLRITTAVWVVLLAARGFSLWQIGLAEGIFHIVSLLGEVPSGMAADLMGRRRTLALSGVLGALSSLAMISGAGYGWICLSMGLSALSYNLISGTQEAITYDSLVAVAREQEYLQIDANCCQLQTLGNALSDLCSMLAGVLSYVGFYLADACITLSRTALALALAEPVVTERQAASHKNPFAGLKGRFFEHLSTTLLFLRQNPAVLQKIMANALISLPGYLTLMFLQQRLTELGTPVMLLGLPILAVELAGMAGIAVGRRLRIARLRPFYALCTLLCGLGTVCAGLAPLWAAVAGAMLATACFNAWFLHSQKSLNAAYPSDQRATLVSVDSMAYSVLMIAASPLTGLLGDAAGTAGAGLAALGLLLAAAGGAAAVKCRR